MPSTRRGRESQDTGLSQILNVRETSGLEGGVCKMPACKGECVQGGAPKGGCVCVQGGVGL